MHWQSSCSIDSNGAWPATRRAQYFLLICHDNVNGQRKLWVKSGENSRGGQCVVCVFRVTSQTSAASSTNAVKTQLDLDSSSREQYSKVAQLKRSVAKIPVRCVEKPLSDVKMSTICAVNAVKGKHWTQPVNQRVPFSTAPPTSLPPPAALVPWERIKIYFAGISVLR